MKEIRYNKKRSRHNFLKALVITVLLHVTFVNIVVAVPPANISFVTTGSSFSPIITVTGSPSIQWVFGDGSTSNSTSPTINFGSEGTRTNTLVVTPWNAVTKINLGYDGSDDGVTPNSSTIASLAQQNVIDVSGLDIVAPYLQVWASSYNPIITLDFNNFTALHTIECFHCASLTNIKLHNVPALNRLCCENCNISYLDLSEAPSLADLRGAEQKSSTYTINWGSTGAKVWHICVHGNPQFTNTLTLSDFPKLKELYISDINQRGALYLTSTNLVKVISANNHYTDANFSGCFLADRNNYIDVDENDLTSLDISNNPGLLYLSASFNLLNQTSVDGVLQTLDLYNTKGGFLDLTGNAAPSIKGLNTCNNLTNRGWNVQVSSNNNQPIAHFTVNVSSGMNPLPVQFNDTSMNNPTTCLWDFGDGTNSTNENPVHTYNKLGKYTVSLKVANGNGTSSKTATINVHKEPVANVHAIEISQPFISSGSFITYNFPQQVTPVVYLSFNSKKKAGETTTKVEMLNGISSLVSGSPSGEVYKYFNIWVDTGVFGDSNNIGNASVYFRVEKSWISNKNIDQSSIILNRYDGSKWNQLPTTLSGEDSRYLYFTAITLGFSTFGITGKTIVKQAGSEINPAQSNIGSEVEQTTETGQKTETPANKITTGFEMIYGIDCMIAVTAACLLIYIYKKYVSK